jgi:SAM-dependent methyltransferase
MVSFVEPLTALRKSPRREERRSAERLRLHYMVERRLAERLRAAATPEERSALRATTYEELFQLVPDHPRLLALQAAQAKGDAHARWNKAFIARFLKPGSVFLQIGELDGALAVADGSLDVAFSDEVLEHLHPDDVAPRLAEIHRALRAGGVYACVTPNRLYGPSDISAYFDDEPRGFHLREYSVHEVRRMLRAAGFSRVRAYIGGRGWYVRCPLLPIVALEHALGALPVRLRRRIADHKPMRALLGVRVAAIK